MHIYMHIFLNLCIHIYIRTYAYIYTYIYIHMCIHIYIHIYIYIHMYVSDFYQCPFTGIHIYYKWYMYYTYNIYIFFICIHTFIYIYIYIHVQYIKYVYIRKIIFIYHLYQSKWGDSLWLDITWMQEKILEILLAIKYTIIYKQTKDWTFQSFQKSIQSSMWWRKCLIIHIHIYCKHTHKHK